MQELMYVKEMGKEILSELESFNKRVWNAVSFRLIHATLSNKKELQDSNKNAQYYRKQRVQKAIAQTKGNKRKAYELLSSEDFI